MCLHFCKVSFAIYKFSFELHRFVCNMNRRILVVVATPVCFAALDGGLGLVRSYHAVLMSSSIIWAIGTKRGVLDSGV